VKFKPGSNCVCRDGFLARDRLARAVRGGVVSEGGARPGSVSVVIRAWISWDEVPIRQTDPIVSPCSV
jgi:hypothetical protein